MRLRVPQPVAVPNEAPLPPAFTSAAGLLRRPTAAAATLRGNARLEVPAAGEFRILDFDVETVAAGFADPDWVPQKVTCVAWSWIGEDDVQVRVCGPEGIFGDPSARARMLAPLLDAINEADMLTGHNIRRFDLPVVNSECLRLGFPSLPSKLVQDTIKIVKTKGFKKGQDNLGRLLHTQGEKLALDWQAWQDAYDEDGWQTVKDRCVGDIIQHKELRLKMLDAGWLKSPRMWSP